MSVPDFESIISADLISVFEAGIDAIINQLGMTCTITYAAKNTDCPNCVLDPLSRRSANIYQSGGPKPFTNGTVCPWCKGVGLIISNPTESIRLVTIWTPDHWVKIPSLATLDWKTPQTICQVWGYFRDVPKIKSAKTIILTDSLSGSSRLEFELYGEPIPQGLKNNRFFVQMLKRVGS